MQKKLIALAVAGLVSGAAFAQSNVTIYGVVDAGFAYSKSDDRKFTGIQDGGSTGLNTSRIGFKGEEALGNGLKAIFQMEYGTQTDTGASTAFGNVRQSYVGVNGGFGTVALGRQYAPSGQGLVGNTYAAGVASVNPSNAMYNVFATIDSAGGNSRIDNSIRYASPDMAGFQVHAIYGFGEKVSTAAVKQDYSDAGRYGVGVAYANGPVYVSALYQGIQADDGIAGNDGAKGWMVGGAFDLKVVKLYANYTTEKDKRGAATTYFNDSKKTMWTGGVSVPVSAAGKFSAEYTHFKTGESNTTAKGFGIGYVHDLSKRTAVYTFVTRINNDDNIGAANVRIAAVGKNGENNTAFAVGVRHFF